ncbi:hypothetical protein DRH27_04630 [Candidatus Falkowbacteria bacterium]|nr:MAG: hypothetical protein DRH27_04630 [Candidatus Falkowbacteria bacterium]
MQQFTVPQFIDVEDKIIGPITARQFVIMLSGFLLIALCYRLFSFTLFVAVGLSIFAVSGIFAFLKINGMPFHFFILNFIQTTKRPSLRVWSTKLNENIDLESEEVKPKKVVSAPARIFSTSHLAELALIVDTQGVYKGEERGAKSEIKPNPKNF